MLSVVSKRLSYGFGKGGGWEWSLPQDCQDTHKIANKINGNLVEGLATLCDVANSYLDSMLVGVTGDPEVLRDVRSVAIDKKWTASEAQGKVDRVSRINN